MKKIFLALAAVAALASCVKENTLVPEQTADNLVTITAVSADTKTTLDGVNVLWEENDEIAVVVEGKYEYLETFTTSSKEKASTAEFTAVLSDELVADETVTGVGYAVYPAESATYADGNVSIAHVLPEVQTGTITKGMNLSYAKVDADDIKARKANAVFSNALTLLKVNVPEGVKSVVLESDIMSPALVGTVNFTVTKTVDNISFVKGSTDITKRSVTLSNGGAELEEGMHDLLVFPGTAKELTLTMTGTNDAVYESTLNEVELVAGTYRTINLTNVFKMGVKDVEAVSPMGGTFDYEVVATTQYDYKVAIEENPTWIRLNEKPHVTKTFVGTKVSFTVDANTTGSTRNANVTITWKKDGEEQNKKFKITQESAYLDFVYVDPADPASGLIQWEETFDIFGEMTLNNKITASPYKGVFTIEINEENPEKGTYIVKNIFKNSQFTSGGNHLNEGGEYYANYGDGKLTILKSNANISSYVFANDVVLTYDPSLKKFTSGAIELGYTPGGLNNQNYKFIGNYEAVHYVAPDPGAGGGGDSSLNAFVGTWSETYVNKPYSWSAETVYEGEFTVSIVDGKLYFENMFIYMMYSTKYTANYYGTLSGDGKTITLEDAGSPHGNFGPINYSAEGSIVLTVNVDGSLSVASAYSGNVKDYVATKK